MTAAAIVIGIVLAALAFCATGAWTLYELYDLAIWQLQHRNRKANR